MKEAPPDLQPPLSQLLDVIEGRLDSIAGTLSETDVKTAAQINDAISRMPTIFRRMKNIKNRLAPVNRIPPETLAHVATFFAKERDLVNATAVCRHWRETLLSFPRLWRNAGGNSPEIKAYIERSKSTPLDVSLLYPSFVEFVIPHASRLAGLTVRLVKSSNFSQIAERLRNPLPMLHTFRVTVIPPHPHALEFPPDLDNPFLSQTKKLELRGISTFLGPQSFPNVTELVLHTIRYVSTPMDRFLRTFEQLPSLERVSITFHASLYTNEDHRVVTLSHVQEMSLSVFADHVTDAHLPDILQYLRLPKLTSLCVQSLPRLTYYRPIFPHTTFREHLPNLAQLPELQVNIGMSSDEVTFRSPSGATLKYLAGPLSDYESHESRIWRQLPLRTVRRLTVNMGHQLIGSEFDWLSRLLQDLEFLEHLELGGECGEGLRWLCGEMTQDRMHSGVETLTVRCGEHERPQALKLKRLADAAGVTTTLICASDPRVHEEREAGTSRGDLDDERDEVRDEE
ncbi:hypothetical protein BJ322DRAFT_1073218 [Thelephora terrestris]|uniref:F-box domain-containing protein n=1 Tax=Thelephora terrestris TaxID=56493 RepID=A0A9P6HC03_9AGAM|nr:hypothetical protein BJ322DRAFT_1073218 [Thelephora terrestris]